MAKHNRDDQDFHEFMPAYMNQAGLFNGEEQADEPSIRGKMLRQLGFLVLLLILQVILFFVLITNTVNLS